MKYYYVNLWFTHFHISDSLKQRKRYDIRSWDDKFDEEIADMNVYAV